MGNQRTPKDSLMCLPNRELGTLEGANRRFEGFGKRQGLLVGLLLKVDGPAKALADVIPRLVIHLCSLNSIYTRPGGHATQFIQPGPCLIRIASCIFLSCH